MRDSHYFWRKFKNKIAPDKPNNTKAFMDSFGKIQGIEDSELRDNLQDPVKRSGVYTEVLCNEIEKATTQIIKTTREGLKEETKADYDMLKSGNF